MTSSSHEAHGGQGRQAYVDPAIWRNAEEHILDRVAALTRWDAERWAVAHERKYDEVASMAARVSYFQAGGDSPACDYLSEAFDRIDAGVAELEWAQTPEADSELAGALNETLVAVTAVARHALATVVFADDYQPTTA